MKQKAAPRTQLEGRIPSFRVETQRERIDRYEKWMVDVDKRVKHLTEEFNRVLTKLREDLTHEVRQVSIQEDKTHRMLSLVIGILRRPWFGKVRRSRWRQMQELHD